MPKTIIFYLSRKNNPARWSRNFLKSLIRFPAGDPCQLVFMLKGYAKDDTDPVLQKFQDRLPIPATTWRVSDELFPIEVFFAAAEAFDDCKYILFLVSQSRILAPDWLAKFNAVFESNPECGVVGATGNFEAQPGASFPNVNVRTTGFMIKRDVFLNLDRGSQAIKRDGVAFEAGPNSMTAQLIGRGLQPFVVGRDGVSYPVKEWPASRTFRSGRQENLLIADNRTRRYARAGLAKRQALAQLSFADQALVEASSLWDRIAAL